MTPRDFLAVAVLLSTNFDERMALAARREMEKSMRSGKSGDFWREHYEEDLQRIGAKRALWLEAATCGWWAGTPKPGHEEQVQFRIDPEDWNPCLAPVERDGMCSAHADAAAELRAVIDGQAG